MRLDAFRVTLGAGLLFMALLIASILGATSRQASRAEEAGLAFAALDIKQMNCSMCKAEILHTLRGTEGVDEVTPERKGAAIAYDASKLGPRDLVKIVRKLGYDAELRE